METTLLAAIPDLAKWGIKLLEKRGQGRKEFIEKVAEPLNKIFEQLVSEHMATFTKIDDALSVGGKDVHALQDVLERNALFESSTIELLRGLVTSHTFTKAPQSSIEEAFEAYVYELASCLIVAAGEQSEVSVAYYESLGDLLRRYIAGGGDRRQLRDAVRQLIKRFNDYKARVSQRYIELRSLC